MNRPIKTITAAALAAATVFILAGCEQSDTVNWNTTRDAKDFKLERRVVFFNGITDNYLLSIEGKCNIEDQTSEGESQLEVICKTDDGQFKKHVLGLSDNVSYFVEQLEPNDADPFHYKVIFRPETIIPDIDLETSGDIEGDGE